MKENAETVLVASKEIGLEVNADKTNCMVMSRDQNAARSHSIKTDNSSFEMVEELTNENSVQEKIKGRSNLVDACYHSVQNHPCSSWLSKKN